MQAPGNPHGLAVVGRSGADAGAIFGHEFRDALETSNDRFFDDVDLAQVAAVALGDGADLRLLLPAILDRRPSSTFELLVELGPSAVECLPALLLDTPLTGITSVTHEAGATVLRLGNARDGVSGDGVRVLVDGLQIGPTPTWETEAEAEAEETPDPSAPLFAWAGSRRHRQALLSAAVLLVVGVLVLLLIGRSDAGSTGVLVTLGVATVLAQGLLLAVTILVLRRTSARHSGAVATAGQVKGLAAQLRTTQANQKRLAQQIIAGSVHRRATMEKRSEQLHLDTHRQVQALLNLDRMVRFEGALPPMGGWAASPDLLVLCVQSLIELRPAMVVECGSGVSTLLLALATKQHALPTRLVALEHDELYAEQTRAMLRQHGVLDRVDVRHAPLEPTGLPGHDTAWYAQSALVGLEDIGMLLVDGPPGLSGPQARYPAVPLLFDRLSPSCLIVMDDLNRDSDREVAERWAEEFPKFQLRVVTDFQKHVGLLRRDG